MSERWRKVLRGLGWLWLALPLLLPALLMVWSMMYQSFNSGGSVGWAVLYSENWLDWVWSFILWLGPALTLLWFGRRQQA